MTSITKDTLTDTVRDSLSVTFARNESDDDAKLYGLNAPFFDLMYDFVLRPAR